MITRKLIVESAVGLHARPAAQFAAVAKDAPFPVKVGRDESSAVNAASPLRLLTLKIKQGEEIFVICETKDISSAEIIFDKLNDCIKK
jgi:phosphocarrier protein